MSKLRALIGAWQEAGAFPESIDDDFDAAWSEDIGPFDGKISELTAGLEGKDDEIKNLIGELTASKAHNYDLLKQVPATIDAEGDSDSDDNNVGDVDADDGTVNDLFEEDVE